MFNVKTLEINFFNEKFLKTFGYHRYEVINKMKIENLFTDKDDYQYFINKIDNDNNINFDFVKLKLRNNTFIYASFSATPFNLQEGKYFIINIVNISNSVTKQQKYQKLASIDELTSLPNRRNYIEKFDEKVLNKEEFSVILLDLDGFKSINDTYGHNIGDDALIAISRRLMAYNDNENIIARIGGDEFAMLIKNDQSNKCNLKLNDITNTFNEPIILGNIQIKVTYSAGVSFYPKDGRNLRVLFDKADIALYKAKEYEESKLFEYSDLIKK